MQSHVSLQEEENRERFQNALRKEKAMLRQSREVTEVMWLQAKVYWKLPETGRSKKWLLPYSFWREHGPADTLVLAW